MADVIKVAQYVFGSILRDVARSVLLTEMPRSFQDLHDQVDANEYVIEAEEVFGINAPEDDFVFVNAVTEFVDSMIHEWNQDLSIWVSIHDQTLITNQHDQTVIDPKDRKMTDTHYCWMDITSWPGPPPRLVTPRSNPVTYEQPADLLFDTVAEAKAWRDQELEATAEGARSPADDGELAYIMSWVLCLRTLETVNTND